METQNLKEILEEFNAISGEIRGLLMTKATETEEIQGWNYLPMFQSPNGYLLFFKNGNRVIISKTENFDGESIYIETLHDLKTFHKELAKIITNPSVFMQEIRDAINAVNQSEFQKYKEEFTKNQWDKKFYIKKENFGEMPEWLATYHLYCYFINSKIIKPKIKIINFLELTEYKREINIFIVRKFDEWYKDSENSIPEELKKVTYPDSQALAHLAMLHGKATDAIATMNSKGIKPDDVTGNLTITSNEVKLAIEKFNSLPGTLGISTHKLLYKAISEFALQNHIGNVSGIRSYNVEFPLKEYALQCGYDVEERPTSTSEAAKREKKRVKNALDNFRKKVKKDIGLLMSFRLTWEENIKGKSYYFDSMNVMGRGTIKNGIVGIEFTVSMAEYLIQLPLSQYPIALFGVDERNPNAYIIGLKMAEHYNNDNNLIAGTANLLKVKTLLAHTSFPNLNAVRETEHSWTDRIKEPFETALDVLTQNGVLADWRYSHSKGAEMSNTEATNFESYEEWADTLIYFELKNPVNHTERLTRLSDKKKEAKKQKPKRKKKLDE